MSKECKTARNVVVLTFILVFSMLVMMMSSCASSNCQYSAKAKRVNNLCPAYRQNG